MRSKAIEVVRGATTFDGGEIEGKLFGSSGTVFVDVSLDKEGKGYGVRTEPMRCVGKEVVDRIKHLPFPFRAEIEFEMQATAKKTTLVVLEVKPINRADGKPFPEQPAKAV